MLQNIPVAFFSKHLQGRNGDKTAKLRSDASDRTWEVVIDGRRLTGGWKEFVTTHDLRAGDVLVFRHEGDLVFHVTALGPSCCEAEYTTLDDCDEHKDTVGECSVFVFFCLNCTEYCGERSKFDLSFGLL